MCQVATDKNFIQEIFKINVKSIEQLEVIDNEALSHVEGGLGHRWIYSKNR